MFLDPSNDRLSYQTYTVEMLSQKIRFLSTFTLLLHISDLYFELFCILSGLCALHCTLYKNLKCIAL